MIESIAMRSILQVCSLLVVFLIAQSCEKEELKSENYFPVGRTSVLNNNLAVITNNQELTYELVYDGCGGYWLKFNASQVKNRTEVIVKFTGTSQQTEDFIDNTHLENWLNASWYIDCDNEAIIDKALEITEGLNTNLEKATKIQQYTAGYLDYYTDYYKPADVKASLTLEEGIGVCMNFSRLFVALCRASGVPSRTVWGIVDGYDGLYHYHHQWAEACDGDGIWHTCDFGRINGFFNNEINYLDLIYGPEENSTITGFTGWVTLLNDLEYWHNYPVAFTGSIPNFERVSMDWPDSIVVECTLNFDLLH